VKRENPDASFGELGKLIGAKWHELEEDERNVSLAPPPPPSLRLTHPLSLSLSLSLIGLEREGHSGSCRSGR
jgi:hypothetical protein